MKNDRYNYAYLDPMKPVKLETDQMCFLFQPLYVGKGGGNRYLHGVAALTEEREMLTNRLLYVELKRLFLNGKIPVVVVFNTDVSNTEALIVEDRLISLLGRKDLDPNGILCNRARGGAMPDVSGVPKLESTKRKMVSTRRANGTYATGAKHPRAKRFVLVSPTGERHELDGNLKTFCATHNLSWQMLFAGANKGILKLDRAKHKNLGRLTDRFWNTLGWECQRLDRKSVV